MPETVNLHYGNLYEDDKYVRIRYGKYIRLIKEWGRSAEKLLEIGCYTAELSALLPETINYTGIDFDEKAIAIAKSKDRNAIKMNFNEGKIEFKERFDIIIAAEVLEHLIDPAQVMNQIRKLLEDDGIILISLPNENTLYHRLLSLSGIGIDMYPFELYKHLHFATIKQNIKFVEKYFRIIKKEYYVNPGGKGSRFEKLGVLFAVIPDFIWEGLAVLFPGLFARGIILLAKKY